MRSRLSLGEDVEDGSRVADEDGGGLTQVGMTSKGRRLPCEGWKRAEPKQHVTQRAIRQV